MVTAVWFSAALTAAVAPPPFDVMTGASLTLVTVTAIACVSEPPLPSLTCTETSYTLFAPASAGVSKFGAAMKVSIPVLALMVNNTASAPPTIAYVGPPPSTSVEVTVVTAVWFSAAPTTAVAPPPFDVMTGASFALVTVTAIACVSVPPLPSATWTVTS